MANMGFIVHIIDWRGDIKTLHVAYTQENQSFSMLVSTVDIVN
jgi:hypothetical protein